VGVMPANFDINEQIVADYLGERFGITLQKIPETPGKGKSPDTFFQIENTPIVLEIKTLENTVRLNQKSVFGEDKAWSRIARAIEKASKQLATSSIPIKAIAILSKGYTQKFSDLLDVLQGFISEPEPSRLHPGVSIAISNLECQPNILFWIDQTRNEFYVRSLGELPSSIETFFREKLNG
jgi:hypothetical protein